MDLIAFARRIYAALAEYERRLDYDATSYLIDRIHALEQQVAELKNAKNNAAGMSANSLARAT